MTNFSPDVSKEELLAQLAEELGPDLKECTPERGIQRFLAKKKPDVTPNTIDQYETKLETVLEYCEKHDIEDLRELDGRTLDDYEIWLRNESSDVVDELSPKTMCDELYLLRECISYLEDIEAVKPDLSKSISIPDLSDGDGVRDVDLDPERLQDILDHLEKFHYATLDHVVFLLLARTGRRTGGIHSLDVDHVHHDIDDPYLDFKHLPPETRLKNNENSEEHVAIADDTAKILSDYITTTRHDVTHGQSRAPLLTTRYGRVSKSSIRRIVYSWSRPCEIGAGCPHDRDPEACSAAQIRNAASKCPSSRSPHTLKHGYISECRRRGIPIDILSDRCDVGEDLIREVYDETTQEERCQMRRQVLDEYSSGEGGGYL